jgi:hypothetical protein
MLPVPLHAWGGQRPVVHFLRQAVTPGELTHMLFVCHSLPATSLNASWPLLRELARLPEKSFIPSQLCLPRQMFCIKNTKSCPEDSASKTSLSAVAFRRWGNVAEMYPPTSPQGRKTAWLTVDQGPGIGQTIALCCDEWLWCVNQLGMFLTL